MSAPPVVTTPAALRTVVGSWRREGRSVGFAPTMGNLHDGHLELVRAAARRSDRVVVSIFVNPLQFGPNEDYAAYPRTLQDDLERLAAEPCDLVFAPDEVQMYPSGRARTTRVEVPGLAEILCGASRPGHFGGVATVVARLFNLVQPDLAAFGEKDFQQLAVIRRMSADLGFPVEILGVATRREPDGLAMSSRNRYLEAGQRAVAPALFAALQAAAQRLQAGDGNFVAIQQEAVENIRSAGLAPEYVEVRRRQDLEPATARDRALVVLAAARLGRARLIDNVAVDR